ncbi:MAG TPA: TIGR03667 family PPOX class F420-dependent oxidoreductase [Rubrobacter sp.]|nr:TIGR03667 family PPOX class F420-dependent oxidoreductase [Rubrobacter sp.]
MLDTTSEAGARAEARLQSEEIAWLATVRPDGQPQSVPVWFLWDGEGFLVYSRPGARKLRNIEANPKINLNLNSNDAGGDVVRAECEAEVLADAPPATEVGSYLEKYREAIGRIGFDPDGFARAYSVAIRATPARWQVW